jgi:hypothetical protein
MPNPANSAPAFILPRAGKDNAAVNVCSAAGIELMKQEQTRLNNIRQALDVSLREIESAKNWEEFLSKGLLTANLVKASCDAFLELAGSFGDFLGMKQVKTASTLLTTGTAVTDSAIATAYGAKTDWVGTGNKVAKTAAGMLMEKNKVAKGYKDVAKLQFIKVDIINTALREDDPAKLYKAFKDYGAQLATMSLDFAKQETAGRVLGLVNSVANVGMKYSQSLDKAFNTRIDDTVEIAERRNALLAQTRRDIRQVTSELARLDQLLQQCGQGLATGRLA